MLNLSDRMGVSQEGDELVFRVWAPYQSSLSLEVTVDGVTRHLSMLCDQGVYCCRIPFTGNVITYYYVSDSGECFSDPCSRYQPQGVLGPSAYVPDTFEWEDHEWRGIPLEACIFYELHVGTFTEAGTFEAIIEHIDRLQDLGVTCVKLMPVAQFSGRWNWGYDGVFPFAVQDTYGGPRALKRLINALHLCGIAVALDVVYNHIGPEGCCLQTYGAYFSKTHSTPWGNCLNLDGDDSLPVRNYVRQNILQWVDEFHIDALRFDAIHHIKDDSAIHLLREVSQEIDELARAQNRNILLIGEANVHNSLYLKSSDSEVSWGVDSIWCDDFAYAAQASFTEVCTHNKRTYQPWQDFLQVLGAGRIFDGVPWAPQRVGGSAAAQHPGATHIAYLNNHDITGNDPLGRRALNALELSEWELLTALLFLMPHLPMLFMGDEYGEPNPFFYFVDHKNEQLLQLIREGRAKEYADYDWSQMTAPDSVEAFSRSKCHTHTVPNHKFRWIQSLIQMRKSWTHAGILNPDRLKVDWCRESQTLTVRYSNHACIVASQSIAEVVKHDGHVLLQNDAVGNWKVAVICSSAG
ncbi:MULTISPECIES: alpha-amylase family glycosyl hydrolase [unclassified Lentimonas]|uniref:alpha-amylase family glycosyl hydrolase n=1 Tax=unclassified Lentimonas TaxID=2630993 RepID=UPI001389AE64|nr:MULTISPECIES: alpha-amylase family glycosyl hydrolase [unclassified Lentimonas]